MSLVDFISSGIKFHSFGAEDENARSPYVTDLTDGVVRSERLEDRNDRGGEYSSISAIKYSGA